MKLSKIHSLLQGNDSTMKRSVEEKIRWPLQRTRLFIQAGFIIGITGLWLHDWLEAYLYEASPMPPILTYAGLFSVLYTCCKFRNEPFLSFNRKNFLAASSAVSAVLSILLISFNMHALSLLFTGLALFFIVHLTMESFFQYLNMKRYRNLYRLIYISNYIFLISYCGATLHLYIHTSVFWLYLSLILCTVNLLVTFKFLQFCNAENRPIQLLPDDDKYNKEYLSAI